MWNKFLILWVLTLSFIFCWFLKINAVPSQLLVSPQKKIENLYDHN